MKQDHGVPYWILQNLYYKEEATMHLVIIISRMNWGLRMLQFITIFLPKKSWDCKSLKEPAIVLANGQIIRNIEF